MYIYVYIYICIYMYILSAFRNAINTTIISCGRNETYGITIASVSDTHSFCCFPAANRA